MGVGARRVREVRDGIVSVWGGGMAQLISGEEGMVQLMSRGRMATIYNLISIYVGQVSAVRGGIYEARLVPALVIQNYAR